MGKGWLCGPLLWLFAALGNAQAAPILVNGIAATVGKALITVQDAYFYRALQRFRDGEGDPLRPEQGEELKRTVRKIIFEEMVEEEMKSLKYEEKSNQAEIRSQLGTEKSRARQRSWEAILQHFGKSETAAVEVLARSQRVDRFIDRKIETLTPIITQADVERYIQQNEARFKGSDVESLKPNIMLLLKKERTQKGLEEWLRFLRDKYGVANYLDS
jgi:hypothetical protein